jgi:hypothetical protein
LSFECLRGWFQSICLSRCFRLPSLLLVRACTPHDAWRRSVYYGTSHLKTQGKKRRCHRTDLVNVPLSPGGSGFITSTSLVLPLGTGEVNCSTPATPGLRGDRLIRPCGPAQSRTGSLTAQLAVRFPVSASVRPLPYSPCNGLPIYTLACDQSFCCTEHFGLCSFNVPRNN